MRIISQIIVHCSDSDVKKHDNIETVRKWHVEERGFIDVGYHFFIQSTGNIERGRTLDQIGAHCKGHNADSIGVCLHGRKEFTTEQFASLKRLIHVLQSEYGSIPVYGHRDFEPNKTCPNFNVHELDYGKGEKHV